MILSRRLGDHLSQQGLVPPNCRSVELLVGTDVLMLRYEVFVQVDELPRLAAAILALHAEMASPLPRTDDNSHTGSVPP
jgi:hypothetical protein